MESQNTPLISRRSRPHDKSKSMDETSSSALSSPAAEKAALDEGSDQQRLAMSPSKEEKSKAPTNAVPCLPEERRKKVEKQLHVITEAVPGAKKMKAVVDLLPPRVKMVILVLTVTWKVVVAIVFISMAIRSAFHLADPEASQDDSKIVPVTKEGNDNFSNPSSQRILYIVTTLAEFNNGLRKTEKGQDRLGEVLIPILVDSVESMVHEPFNYHVDVFIISAFEMKKEREEYIRSRLPDGVGLEIWDDACPHGYEVKHSENKVIDNTRALARQHRYVIKDKLEHYDLFVAFEDDMRITGDHVAHFLKMSEDIDQLRLEAPDTIPNLVPVKVDPTESKYFGPMTRGQMDRLIPGFIRVEVLVNENVNGAQTSLDNIERDYSFDVSEDGKVKQKDYHFNPRICCHVQMKPNKNTPVHPKPSDVIIWETNIKALSALNMPKPKVGKPSTRLDWVGVLPGPGKRLDQKLLVLGYWSGRNGAFGNEEKPSGGRPDIVAQQGGWMATRSQILRMNSGLCMGSFLPPFDEPMYKGDGQESMNVEFWSGGYQFFTGVRGGCNMQRIISLHPENLSNHFIYHVANNKQKQLNRERMLRADDLFAQLNTVRKTAEKALIKDTAKR